MFFLGYGFLKLDGETKTKDRRCFSGIHFLMLICVVALGMPMIDKFHEDPDVFIFLISTLAGGTGLNLTGKVLLTMRSTDSDTSCAQGPTKL